jgi:hypothetical protein
MLRENERVQKEFARGLSYEGKDKLSEHTLINERGVYLQGSGHFKHAEDSHRNAIVHATAVNPRGDFSVYHYNIMLAVTRQGRVEEAQLYRTQHLDYVSKSEGIYGALEDHWQRITLIRRSMIKH